MASVGCDSETRQNYDPETEVAKWNSAIVNVLVTLVTFLLRYVKMSSMKTV